MKYIALAFFLILSLFVSGCGSDDNETDSVSYDLPSTSEQNISGKLVISRNEDQSATFLITLNHTIPGFEYPTHLHYGNLNVENADVASMLTPTSGDTGISETIVTSLSDDTPVTYDDIISGEFSLKVHLGDDAESKKVILTATNVGASFDEYGVSEIAVCGTKERY